MAEGIKVWDPLVRLGHWTIVAGFTVAYLSEDLLSVHVWAGYVVGAAVLIRVVWGFVGPRRARFADFVYAPSAVLTYLADLVRFRAKRYLGHSPAGGAMVVALLLMLAGTVATGVMSLGADRHAGLSFYATAPAHGSPASDERPGRDDEGAEATDGGKSALGELHELLANLTLALVGFHLVGVVLGSIVHRENLVAAMIPGRKRVESERPNLLNRPVPGR
jgi:cytochrome b